MNKKFLKSVAILGLASTALGMTQPVGAVVSGKYQSIIDTYKKEINSLESNQKIGMYNAGEQIDNFLRPLDLARALSNKEEFSHIKYKDAVDKLVETVSKVDGYLLGIKLTADDNKIIKQLKESTKKDKTPIVKLSKVSPKQYNKLKETLEEGLHTFAKAIVLIQKNNPELITLPLYFEDNLSYVRFVGRLDENYYDNFFNDYLGQAWGNSLFSSVSTNRRAYISGLKELAKLMEEIEKLLLSQHDTEELSVYYSIALGDKNKANQIVLSEKLPNIYSVKEKIDDLKSILFDFYEKTGDKENMKKYQVAAQPSNSLNFDTELPKERQKKYQSYLSELKETLKRITERNEKNKIERYSLEDEEDENKDKKLMIVRPKEEIKYPVVTETIQSIPMLISQSSHTEIITVTFTPKFEMNAPIFRGTTTGLSSLSEMNGESSLPYTKLIGGSNTIPLAEVEGGHSDIVLESQNPKTPVISGSTQTNQLSDKSDESDIVEVDYKTEAPQEVLKASEELKVTEAPVAQDSQVLSEVIQVSDELENQNSLDDYTKSQINFWIGDFSSTLNKLTSNQLHSEDLADLISRGQELRKKLDNALGEGKYNGDLKRDLDQLETISNAISRMTGI